MPRAPRPTTPASGWTCAVPAAPASSTARCPPTRTRRAVGAIVDRLRAECTGLGGALVVLDGPAEVKAAVDTWGPSRAIDLMRRVKERFDPERRLSPGRFVGGI